MLNALPPLFLLSPIFYESSFVAIISFARPFMYSKVINHVIAVCSENKLQHYAAAYRNHKGSGEKGLFRL